MKNKPNFKQGAYATLRSTYKKSMFFKLNLVEWTLGQIRKFEIRSTKYETNTNDQNTKFNTSKMTF